MTGLATDETTGPVITVNGRTYRIPVVPVVVITVDGGDPEYFADAVGRDLMPNLAAMLRAGGEFQTGASEMPSLTNPNNISIVTGVSPAIHGIPGNYCRLSDGRIELLNHPDFLRAPSIHAAFQEAGVRTLMVTTKDKLRRLLGKGGVPSVSVEKASGEGLAEYGIDDLEELVGEPAPGIYDPRASHYAIRLALAIWRANRDIRLIYVSLTDFVQHSAAPGSQMADQFFIEFDTLLGEIIDEGFTIGITADHGMNSKHAADGTPRSTTSATFWRPPASRSMRSSCRSPTPTTDTTGLWARSPGYTSPKDTAKPPTRSFVT